MELLQGRVTSDLRQCQHHHTQVEEVAKRKHGDLDRIADARQARLQVRMNMLGAC